MYIISRVVGLGSKTHAVSEDDDWDAIVMDSTVLFAEIVAPGTANPAGICSHVDPCSSGLNLKSARFGP